jgi:hypothetical protein
MAKRLDISNLNIYYSDFLAVEGVNMIARWIVSRRAEFSGAN